jgi:hypothetical protein
MTSEENECGRRESTEVQIGRAFAAEFHGLCVVTPRHFRSSSGPKKHRQRVLLKFYKVKGRLVPIDYNLVADIVPENLLITGPALALLEGFIFSITYFIIERRALTNIATITDYYCNTTTLRKSVL